MISLNCPAKLNVGLKVVGKRPDGFHELSGMMIPLPWFDRIDVDLCPAGCLPPVTLNITRESWITADEIPEGESNIVFRAASLWLNQIGMVGRMAAVVHLHKTIPAGTGLGGASSDAAGVLKALNCIAESCRMVPPDREATRFMAAELGSDCVFFLQPVLSRVTGRGERFVPLQPASGGRQPVVAAVVVVPAQRLATGAVFDAWDRMRNVDGTGATRLTAGVESDISPCPSVDTVCPDVAAMSPELFENDLSDAVFVLCPRSSELVRILRESGASGACVTGSGSAVFGLYADIGSATRAARAIAPFIKPGEIVRALQAGKVY